MRAGTVVASLLAIAITALGCSGGTAAIDTAAHDVEIRALGCRGALPTLGSGTAVGSEMVLTVAHVVAGAETITVTDAAGDVREAQLAAIDPTADLAVLAVPGLVVTDLELSSLEEGETGTAHGLGTAGEIDWSITRTVTIRIADIYGEGVHERPGYELEASISHGDSGAALFAEDGSIGGVVFATSRRDPDRAWATDIAAAAEILEAAAAVTPPGPPAIPCVEPRVEWVTPTQLIPRRDAPRT